MKHSPRPDFLFATALALGPMFIWAAHFGLVYLVDHVACAAADSTASAFVHFCVVAITLLALTLLLFCYRLARHRLPRLDSEAGGERFLSGIVRLLALLAALAIVWIGFGSLLLPACSSLR